MHVETTALDGVLVLTPRVFGDIRGEFSETYNAVRFRERTGFDPVFVQDNESVSLLNDTVRGLHLQAPPHAQSKLVRVVYGAVLDVVVDARRGTPTYGHWISERLTAENGRQLWIPPGFLHGFRTLVPETRVIYKVDAHYAPESEITVRFDDRDLGIDWGCHPDDAVLSEKDMDGLPFSSLPDLFPIAAE